MFNKVYTEIEKLKSRIEILEVKEKTAKNQINELQQKIKNLQEEIKMLDCEHKYTILVEKYHPFNYDLVKYREICTNCNKVIKSFNSKLEFEEAKLKKAQKEVSRLKEINKLKETKEEK